MNTEQKTEPKKEKKPTGRPSLFSEAIAQKIIELAGKGRTDEQIAEIVGVCPMTICNWKRNKQGLMWSIREAKAKADELVEASLFRKALGYNVEERKVGRDGVVECERHVPADTSAIIFWLKNRKPKEWRDRVEVEQESTHTFVLETGDGTKRFLG